MKHIFIKLVIFLLISLTSTAMSAPQKKLWPRWTAHDPAATQTIDYSSWQNFLDRYVSMSKQGINLVNYGSVTPQDKQMLKDTIAKLAATPIDKYNRNEQLAYWINLYNALTISVVLDHYPINSIRDINLSSGLLSGNGPWDAKLIKVEHAPISLNDIEHRILRPIWADPRLHYALNCASISCPNLLKTPYTGQNVHQLLNQNAKDYINSPRGVLINAKNQLIVSSIYKWYQSDFGSTDLAVIAHLKKYADPTLKKALAGKRRIDGDDYNWSLNENK